MDRSRSSSSLYYRTQGVSPKKSPTAENVQKRRIDIEKSERAAYWALFNTSISLLLYYDLRYLRSVEHVSVLMTYVEWTICLIFLTSALYDLIIHFWPHTFMKPIIVSPTERKQLGIQEDEFGFEVEEQVPVKFTPIYDNFPPFEIHHSFEEDEKVKTPQKKQLSPDTSMNTSKRSRVVDKETLIEYLKNCQLIEDCETRTAGQARSDRSIGQHSF